MKTISISHFNGFRNENELVIYTGTGTTGSNGYGLEAVVQNGRVVAFGKNNYPIPEGGYVASGHGKAAGFLADAVCVGARAVLDRENMTFSVEIDEESKKILAGLQIDAVKQRFEARVSEKAEFDKSGAESLIAEAEASKEKGDYDAVKALTDDAYYLTSLSKKGEIRAVWHRPHEISDSQVENTIKRLSDAGFNLILIETNYEGYANAQKCVYDFLPLWDRYKNGYDVIDAFIRIGRQYGMKVHAWFEDFFFGCENSGCPMAEIHPEWMARRRDGGLLHDAYDTFYFLNPALEEVRALLLKMIKDLLDNYDFDGLQLDYIRYPVSRGIDRSAGYEEQTKKMFLADTGIDLDSIENDKCDEWKKFVEWRAQKITSYVSSVHDLIMEYRANGRDIQLSTAVFGDPEEAVRLKSQDWRYWVKQGWLDAIYPMAYFNDAEAVGREVANMVRNYGEAPNISGIAPMYNHLPVIESTKQVEECRRAGASGIAFFAAHSCTDIQLEKLKMGVFRDK